MVSPKEGLPGGRHEVPAVVHGFCGQLGPRTGNGAQGKPLGWEKCAS